MPWHQIGRYLFDLDAVVLVTKGVETGDGVPSVTISLASGKDLTLNGQEAVRFMAIFEDHVEARSTERGPPEPDVIVGFASNLSRPEDSGGVESGGSINVHTSTEHQGARV